MTVHAGAVEGERHHPVQNQIFQRGLGLIGQRLLVEILATQRQLGRLDTDQPHLAAVVQHHGVAIDDFDDRRRQTGLQARIDLCGRR